MKAIWLSVFIISSVLLIAVVLRQKLSWSWFRSFSLNFVMAAVLLYLLNYSSILPDVYIPLNPITIGTVVALGIPGVALILGLQWIVV
ncbi:inhibitor of the pro-sigma K processing machinery [Paenibacillus castaneae]|uniref:pro-sigmaK processing inhibitor BofA family protein n=1 Tax=Paenibacillus castaneae TaxID=474957 RepID=UPI000C9C2C25|nr:pro-sigmaK processing inhibitor BofA family protein [Paenibacillus castaneae]NIK79887.1 inhibitor of the pro-sigma K processing machinery [Paenibacillus castaneae]